jgi:hypothetical protein
MLSDSRNLEDQLQLAVRQMQVSRIPRAPAAPAPVARLAQSTSTDVKPLSEQIEKAPMKLLKRNNRSAVPPTVQEEAVRAAKDMRKALAEQNPPLAPAAPAPVLSAAEPLHQSVGDEAAKAAQEMTQAHYPPLAPANPAPDVIAKDAVSKKSLQEKLLPAAIHTMQNVDAVAIPDAPPAPSPDAAKGEFVMAQPLSDQLARAVQHKSALREEKQRKAQVDMAQHHHHSVKPALPPRPSETLAAMAAMHNAPTTATPITPVINVTQATAPVMAVPVVPVVTATTIVPASSYSGSEGVTLPEERQALDVMMPMAAGEKEIPIDGLTRKEKKARKQAERNAKLSPVVPTDATLGSPAASEGTNTHNPAALSPNASTAGRGSRRGSITRKIKGAMKEVTGTITRNPAKVEEGKMLLHGIDPATATTGAATSSSASNTSRI